MLFRVLYLRRFLIPFFNLTFSRRDSLELSIDDFETLLIDPKEFESKKRLKNGESRDAEVRAGETGTSGQLRLGFEGSEGD